MDQILATLTEAGEAEHWLNVLRDHGIGARAHVEGEGIQVLVAAADYSAASELFSPPGDVEQETLESQVEGPPLLPNERTALLVQTDQVIIAEKVCARLHHAGLFADVIDAGNATLALGGLGQPTYSVRVSERHLAEAAEHLRSWAEGHSNDFVTSLGLSKQELAELLLRMVPGHH